VGEGSPGAAVLELWEYLRAGAVPSAAALYDEGVRNATGTDEFAGGLAALQPDLVSRAPKVVKDERVGALRLLTVRGVAKGEPAQEYSYTLRRQGGRWFIVFDTLLSRAISSYVTARTEQTGGKNSGRTAAGAGAGAAERFRSAGVDVVARIGKRAGG